MINIYIYIAQDATFTCERDKIKLPNLKIISSKKD